MQKTCIKDSFLDVKSNCTLDVITHREQRFLYKRNDLCKFSLSQFLTCSVIFMFVYLRLGFHSYGFPGDVDGTGVVIVSLGFRL